MSETYAVEQPSVKQSSWEALRSGNAVAVMRHALAPGFGDPPDFKLGNCKTQRNLSDAGRVQARLIGELLRANGIDKALVSTSEWCRCRETAELLNFGPPGVDSTLNSIFRNRSATDEQTTRLKQAIELWLSDPTISRVLVTHQVNISALTGHSTGSGDIQIVGIESNAVVVLDTIRAPDAR